MLYTARTDKVYWVPLTKTAPSRSAITSLINTNSSVVSLKLIGAQSLLPNDT